MQMCNLWSIKNGVTPVEADNRSLGIYILGILLSVLSGPLVGGDVLKQIPESWNLDYLYAIFPFFAICEKLQIFGEVNGKF